MRTRQVAVLALVAALSVSCGSAKDLTSTTTTPTSTPTATSTKPAVVLPPCSKIWVKGTRLPARYAGCMAGGSRVVGNRTLCESGQELVVFQNRFYAVTTGTIFEPGDVRKDHGYQMVDTSCRA